LTNNTKPTQGLSVELLLDLLQGETRFTLTVNQKLEATILRMAEEFPECFMVIDEDCDSVRIDTLSKVVFLLEDGERIILKKPIVNSARPTG